MGHSQPNRSDEHPADDGDKPQLALAHTPEAPQDAVWLTACAWCRRIDVHDRWLEAPAALSLFGASPRLTHGICPTCFGEVSLREPSVSGR